MSTLTQRLSSNQQSDLVNDGFSSAIDSSSPSSECASLSSTPKRSPSMTSLVSVSTGGDIDVTKGGKLLDTYGNEFEVPQYTLKQLRDAIPAHCFERPTWKGLWYIFRDLASLTITFIVCKHFITPQYVPSKAARAVLWTLYTVIQGLFGTGLWILGHECGHGALFAHKSLNNFFGWVCHSICGVPFFSWKLSHSKHHKATGHMERDMAFLPRTREQYFNRFALQIHELTEETPFATAAALVMQQLIGFPLYLLTNATGHNNHDRQREGRGAGKKNGWFSGVNHFNPTSPLYENKDTMAIVYSDIGLGLIFAAMWATASGFSWADVFVWYIAPYLWVNHWIVAITFLHHTDPSLPHYTPEMWNFARGASATIDREFGFIGRQLFHGIIETHVLHHLVSTIPFYNADEATEAIKPVMGSHYRSDTVGGPIGFFKSLWRSCRYCQWVEPSEGATGEGKGVLFFRNRNGLGTAPMKSVEVST